jgi:hypothetical protein
VQMMFERRQIVRRRRSNDDVGCGRLLVHNRANRRS